MATARRITYEYEQCGSEIVVKKTGETVLEPIYCCGAEVVEVTSAEKKQTKSTKKTAKTIKTKVAKKKVVKKKRAATKKKRS